MESTQEALCCHFVRPVKLYDTQQQLCLLTSAILKKQQHWNKERTSFEERGGQRDFNVLVERSGERWNLFLRVRDSTSGSNDHSPPCYEPT